jgi:RimJ/RimL family protein N-acetyltransferase/SAM-dependent methyltransferase
MSILLRLAEPDDMRLIFDWRNSPFILERSSSQRAVEWNEHETWFKQAIIDPTKRIYIICLDNKEIGLIRFDFINTEHCVISAYLIKAYIGKGLGILAIKQGCDLIKQLWPVNEVFAYVRADNPMGCAGFRKCGFIKKDNWHQCPTNHTAWHLKLMDSDLLADDKTTRNYWAEDDAKTVAYFTERAEQFGNDVRTLNWGSKASQEQRFAVLANIGDLNNKSILDVGCGLGDFYGWLEKQHIKTDFYGIDITAKLIEMASERFPSATFEAGGLINQPHFAHEIDFVFASGIFCLRQDKPFQYMSEMISIMFKLCRIGIAFNSLSIWSPEQDVGEFYADPLETIAFCKTLTPWVALRHDYHPRDFTIYMYKGKNR